MGMPGQMGQMPGQMGQMGQMSQMGMMPGQVFYYAPRLMPPENDLQMGMMGQRMPGQMGMMGMPGQMGMMPGQMPGQMPANSMMGMQVLTCQHYLGVSIIFRECRDRCLDRWAWVCQVKCQDRWE